MILLILILLIISFLLKNIKENFTQITLPPVIDVNCINDSKLDEYIKNEFNEPETENNIYKINYF